MLLDLLGEGLQKDVQFLFFLQKGWTKRGGRKQTSCGHGRAHDHEDV